MPELPVAVEELHVLVGDVGALQRVRRFHGDLVDPVRLVVLVLDLGERLTLASQALDAVGLMSWKDHSSNELSGGQQHSVAIGRGVFIGHEPKLIIMDEPTAGLGVKQSREVLRLLKELGQKFAVIFITHNLGVIAQVADEIEVMYLGKIT